MNTRREREVAIAEIIAENKLSGKAIGKKELKLIRDELSRRKMMPLSDAALRTFLREMQGGGLIAPENKIEDDDSTSSKDTKKKSTSGSSTANGKSEE